MCFRYLLVLTLGLVLIVEADNPWGRQQLF